MGCFKFIPEGWNDKREIYELDSIKEAYETGKTIQGFVDECDSDCNLYIKLGKNLTGIIPRKEVDLTSCDELGLTKDSVCRNKLNSFVQFKVKEIPNNNVVILSRKKANEEALDWMINNLHVGMVVKGIVRNMRKYGAFVEIGAGVVGLLHIEDISGVYGGVNVENNTQPNVEQNGIYNTTNFNNGTSTENATNVINSGVYGKVENVNNTGGYGNFATNNSDKGIITENADNLINVETNLPAKTGFWNKVKSVLFKEIKIELNPYEQKIEKEINDFLHQEITWQKVKNFLFQDISFGKKKDN